MGRTLGYVLIAVAFTLILGWPAHDDEDQASEKEKEPPVEQTDPGGQTGEEATDSGQTEEKTETKDKNEDAGNEEPAKDDPEKDTNPRKQRLKDVLEYCKTTDDILQGKHKQKREKK